MNIRLAPVTELSLGDWRVWRRIVTDQPRLASPFLHPEFTRLAVRAGRDVEVAVLERAGEPVGFLPFQRTALGTAAPVAEGLSEQQAVIVRDDVAWDIRQVLRACGLRSLRFDHLVGAQLDQFGGAVVRRSEDSPVLDLSRGFDAFAQEKRQAGSQTIPATLRKERKLAREFGPIEFEFHSDCELAFAAFLHWKSAQHRRTDVLDTFSHRWVVELLRQARSQCRDGFQGHFSVLRAGGRPIAVHLGLRTDHCAHVWFPAYDPQFANYSPGMILMLHWIRQLEQLGVQRVDFGPGPQRYKRSLMNAGEPVAMGAIDAGWVAAAARRGIGAAKEWIKASPLQAPAQAPAQMLFRIKQWMVYRST